ncbi:hypothetical protein AVEN_20430-1 [Araneus ventricosus]|uniref:Uncharacterized protein n=1 Tax=Araneus ventricosus TaxID=182803 RepID=A0A4Y2P5B2_ARAVE|nr:hypothetical protein AVEN_20430-1 [Araneus ventricosus]
MFGTFVISIHISLVILTSRFEATRGLFWADLAIFNLGLMTRTTPELEPPFQASAPHRWENVWTPTYDLTCNRPHTRRIFSGIWFRTWSPPAPRPRPYYLATAASSIHIRT